MDKGHEEAKAYANELKTSYSELVQLVETHIPPHSIQEFYDSWAASIQATGYTANNTTKVLALATLEPIIQALQASETDDALMALQMWFSVILKSI